MNDNSALHDGGRRGNTLSRQLFGHSTHAQGFRMATPLVETIKEDDAVTTVVRVRAH